MAAIKIVAAKSGVKSQRTIEADFLLLRRREALNEVACGDVESGEFLEGLGRVDETSAGQHEEENFAERRRVDRRLAKAARLAAE